VRGSEEFAGLEPDFVLKARRKKRKKRREKGRVRIRSLHCVLCLASIQRRAGSVAVTPRFTREGGKGGGGKGRRSFLLDLEESRGKEAYAGSQSSDGT